MQNKSELIEKFNTEKYKDLGDMNEATKVRFQVIISLLPEEGTVLDVGCGGGYLMSLMENLGFKTQGIDVSSNAVKEARKRGLNVKKLNLEENWGENVKTKFDLVVAGEIIEHIYDTDSFLENINHVLIPGGVLIITTPNVATLGRRLMLLLGKGPLLETTLGSEDAGHIRYFTFSTMKNLLGEHGFKTVNSVSTVVNFDIEGKINSKLLAKVFPTLGSTIVIKAVKK